MIFLAMNDQKWKEIKILAKRNLNKAAVFDHTKIKEHLEETFKTNPELVTTLPALNLKPD